MLKINCVVIDDQNHSLELIKNYINKVPFLCLRCATTSVLEALTTLILVGRLIVAFRNRNAGILRIGFCGNFKGKIWE